MTLMPHLARPARSRIARARLYAHDACFLAPFAAPQPDPRAPTHMLTVGEQRFREMFPVTRELQLVSMSVGPRYSRAVLVK